MMTTDPWQAMALTVFPILLREGDPDPITSEAYPSITLATARDAAATDPHIHLYWWTTKTPHGHRVAWSLTWEA